MASQQAEIRDVCLMRERESLAHDEKTKIVSSIIVQKQATVEITAISS